MQNQLLSLEMQALSDRMVDTLVSDLCIGREVDYPDIFVFDGPLLTGEDQGNWAVYDPEHNSILIAHDENARNYEEYDKFARSSVIGDIVTCKPLERTIYLLMHELAHWMTDFVLRNYSHKHKANFRLCYAYLRLRYKSGGF